jgi:hypothetical protein
MSKLTRIQRITLTDYEPVILVDLSLGIEKYTIQGTVNAPSFDYEISADIPNEAVYDGFTFTIEWGAVFDLSDTKQIIFFGQNVTRLKAYKFIAIYTYNYSKNAFDSFLITSAILLKK